jgi:hypothetical protein
MCRRNYGGGDMQGRQIALCRPRTLTDWQSALAANMAICWVRSGWRRFEDYLDSTEYGPL